MISTWSGARRVLGVLSLIAGYLDGDGIEFYNNTTRKLDQTSNSAETHTSIFRATPAPRATSSSSSISEA
jgi:hypothetical protein